MRSRPTRANYSSKGSAFLDGIDWMMRRSCSVLATSVARRFPSEAFNFNCLQFVSSSLAPSSFRRFFRTAQYGKRFLQKFRRVLLTMLLAFPEFSICHEALCPDIGDNWCISIESFVCPGYPFLHRLGVIERSHINVYRYFATRQCSWCNVMSNKRIVLRRADSLQELTQRRPGVTLVCKQGS